MPITNSNISCPCKDCICVPICKNKGYMRLFEDCILLRIYEPRYYDPPRHLKKIRNIHGAIKSNEWGIMYKEQYSKWFIHGRLFNKELKHESN